MFKNMNLAYFDHQATTPVAPTVIEAMMPYLADEFGNPHSSGHSFGWAANAAVESAASVIAEVFSADSCDVVFTSGATEANNIAIQGLARGARGSSRNRILFGATEHKSVLSQRSYLEDELGFEVVNVPVDEDGQIDEGELSLLVDERVLCLSISSANSEIGTLADVNALSKRMDEVGAFLHCDAAQLLMSGQEPPTCSDNMLISVSGHKIYGPKGSGALIIPALVKPLIEPITYGGGQQSGFRPGTLAPFLIVGLAEATRIMMKPETRKALLRVRELRDRLVSRLLGLNEAFSLNGPPLNQRHVANANVCFRGYNADDLLLRTSASIAASTGSACTSGVAQTSHVLRAIGLNAQDAAASIRLSLGLGTTEEQIDRAVEALASVTTST